MWKLAFIIFAIALVSGCVQNTDTPPETPAPSVTKAPTPTPEYEEGDLLDNAGHGRVFSLTEEERNIYEEFLNSMDLNVFANVDPISIAKIFIQYGIDGMWEQEYTMFSPEGLVPTKEDYRQLHVRDVESTDIASRKDQADYMFGNMYKGEFVQDSENVGRVHFFVEEDPFDLYLIKNADGIWQPKYNPFDAP
ncbi:MAG: hypothetical protein LBS62_06635 [Clostridiales bacterium]|jgi:hypothetical protein|nr:hypothetical protein [Clostridiales bacterium]